MDKLEEVRSYVIARISVLREEIAKLNSMGLSYSEEYGSLICRLDEIESVWDIIGEI